MKLRLTVGTCAAGAIVVSGLLTVAANLGGPNYRQECRDAAYAAAVAKVADPSYTATQHPSCAKLAPATRDAITAEVIYAVLPLMLAEQEV